MDAFRNMLPVREKEKQDAPFELDIMKNPYSFKSWWRYIESKEGEDPIRRFWIYERALQELPGSYKLWFHYLKERVAALSGMPIIHPHFHQVESRFERALAFMHKMPRIWQLYLNFLVKDRKLITKSRKCFDRCLMALPVTQHYLIWPMYIEFAKQSHIPRETTIRIYRRYLKIESDKAEEYIDFLVKAGHYGEAVSLLSNLINDEGFISRQGKSKHDMWMRFCDLASKHPEQVTLNVEAIIRSALKRFRAEVGKLWVSLADYFARLAQFERSRDIFEEAMRSVDTIRDFGIIWDAYVEFEYSLIAQSLSKVESDGKEDDKEVYINNNGEDASAAYASGKKKPGKSKKSKKASSESGKRLLSPNQLKKEKELLELRMARYNYLLSRQPTLISDVILRQNPHNVSEWHRRISLFDDDPKLQLAEFTAALTTVDPMKATGKPHKLWIRFARFWEDNGQLNGARQVFSKAVQVNFKKPSHLADVWCAYVEMELRTADRSDQPCKEEQKRARSLIQQATAIPPNHKNIERQMNNANKYGGSGSGTGGSNILTSQDQLFKQYKLWALYADLEESFGTFESTKSVYEKMYELKIATPLTVLNYANFLERNHHFEDSYRAFERGLELFPFPHALDIWVCYLTKFLERHGNSKVERSRDLFEQSIETVPPQNARLLYLMYASFEESYGMARHTMQICNRAASAVPDDQKAGIFNLYIRKAAEFFGVTRAREIFERAIETVPDKDVREFCMRYAKMEIKLGELDRARGILAHCAQFCDPRADEAFWRFWKEFEEIHGNTDTYKEMLRIRRSVIAQYNTTINTAQSNELIEKAKKLAAAEAKTKAEQSKPTTDTNKDNPPIQSNNKESMTSNTKIKSSEIQAQLQPKTSASLPTRNEDEIDLGDAMDTDGGEFNEQEDSMELSTKSVPDAVFGGLVQKQDLQDQIAEAGSKKRKRQ